MGHNSGWETRRLRIGAGIEFLEIFELKGVLCFSDELGSIRPGVEKLYLTYHHNDA